MYIHFEFTENTEGSNPYITTANKTLFDMLNNFEVEQTGDSFFVALKRKKPAKTYSEKKDLIRSIAIQWQADFEKFNYSWMQLSGWEDFFREYGKKYGLLTEFHENGIC